MYAFQRSPVLEPDKAFAWDLTFVTECLSHESFDLLSGLVCHITIFAVWIFINEKLCPDHDMRDASFETIRPIIPEDLVVCWIGEMDVSRRYDLIPVQSFILNELQYRAVGLLEVVCVV